MYGMPRSSAIRNAAAPITGGMICPPVEATASTAPANDGLYPIFFIIGIVKVPVAYTFAAALPDIEPNSADEIVATLAGPPLNPPARALPMSMITSPAPVNSIRVPRMMNSTIYVADMLSGMEYIPSRPKTW